MMFKKLPKNRFVTYEKSSSSCEFSEIQSFTYGGTTSRFWMLRKHLISESDFNQKVIPFFTWECVTLHLKNRDVFLVIQDEMHMKNFLKLLISKLNTIDGTRNSAKYIKDQLYK